MELIQSLHRAHLADARYPFRIGHNTPQSFLIYYTHWRSYDPVKQLQLTRGCYAEPDVAPASTLRLTRLTGCVSTHSARTLPNVGACPGES